MTQTPAKNPVAADQLKQLADQKEKEWREIQQLRSDSLELALRDKEEGLAEEKEKFQKLKEDFKYNLKLLNDRDEELHQYDSVFAEMKAAMNAKNAEISELKIKIDDQSKLLAGEKEQKEELQKHYQQRVKEKQSEIDKYRCVKDNEIRQERDQLESFKRNLERQLREVEEELEIQRQELTRGFDEAMSKREHEFRIQADEMSGIVLSHEMKVKLLSKELDILKAAQEKNNQEFVYVESNHNELEKKLKQTEWELTDTKAMKDARIAELEGHLQQTEASAKRNQAEYQRKYEETDRYSREKEAALTKLKQSHCEKERSLQEMIRELQSSIEDKDIEIRRLEWNNSDLAKEKDVQIQKLQDEINDIKSRWDKQMAELSRKHVARDVEMEALRSSDSNLKSELAQRKHDIERYKKELNQAVEREATLERAKAQLDLDWQKRYENVEREQYSKSEDLVKTLTTARDEALATIKEKDRELKQRDGLIKVLNKDRDAAFATLQQHGITVDWHAEPSSSNDKSTDLHQLHEQNENLRDVIRQMRQEMEQLGHVLPPGGSISGDRGAEEYNKSLEEELRHVKAKNRELILENDRLKSAPNIESLPASALKDLSDNALVRTHIQSLNNTIGALRSEKVELAAQVKKSQARIAYLDNTMDQLSKQPREKQVQIDQLQYEIGAQNRRYQTEVSSLRHRTAELELQLVEARKEADEYHKGNLERNMEATALGNELSNLKMDMAQKMSTINYGAQELIIQQLQDEIQRLRQQVVGENIQGFPRPNNFGNTGFDHGTNEHLKHKLRLAAKQISQLAKEKQQLMEVGNKLRAELAKAGIQIQSQPRDYSTAISSVIPSRPLSQKVQNKLNQLEKLQYELTKQELKFAHRELEDDRLKDIAVDSSSSETLIEDRPRSILKQHNLPPPAARYNPWAAEVTQTQKQQTKSKMPTRELGQQTSLSLLQGRPGSNTPVKDKGFQTSSSSLGEESLQEVWKMLDNGEQMSVFDTPRQYDRDMQPVHDDVVPGINDIGKEAEEKWSWTVQGVRKDMKDRPERKSLKSPERYPPAKVMKKTKIRNYNKTDESHNR